MERGGRDPACVYTEAKAVVFLHVDSCSADSRIRLMLAPVFERVMAATLWL